ncbi:glycosyltransferase family 2 protein [Candidatus Thioglobus sp.]|nr:glycosyltransferase family 2 protein [Candidatus Thioglobus sp.]
MEKCKVAIIIPAFNEGATISNVVKSVEGYGVVIVVNDASTDDTKKKILNSGAILVSHKKNKGYDEALNSGFVKAKKLDCNFVITFDADGQHDPRLINDYISLMKRNYKVVVGVRGQFPRLSESIFSWVSRWKWGVLDPLCGMKGYHMDVYDKLGYFDSYKSVGTEMTIFAASHKEKIAQLAIKIRNRGDSPRFGNRFSSNISILKALWIGYKKYGR